MMLLHMPQYLGGELVELETDGISSDEEVIGWVDEYGTIMSSRANIVIGDLVSIKGRDGYALILIRDL